MLGNHWQQLTPLKTAKEKLLKTIESAEVLLNADLFKMRYESLCITLNSDGLYRKSYMNHRKLQETGNTAEKLAETS